MPRYIATLLSLSIVKLDTVEQVQKTGRAGLETERTLERET